MLDFDGRDLVRHAQDAGFADIELELRVSVKNRKEPIPWERYLRISGNPLVPTIGEALDRERHSAASLGMGLHQWADGGASSPSDPAGQDRDVYVLGEVVVRGEGGTDLLGEGGPLIWSGQPVSPERRVDAADELIEV